MPAWIVPFVAVVPLLAFLLALATYMRAARRDRVDRAIDESVVSLTMANAPDEERVSVRAICAPFYGGDLLLPFRVWVRNDGQKTVTSLKLTIACPRRFYSNRGKPFTSSGATGFQSAVAGNYLSTFSYACDIGELHPGQHCDVVFRLILRPRNDLGEATILSAAPRRLRMTSSLTLRCT
jgi:hypothetical protein